MDDAIDRAAEAKKGSPFLTTDQAAFYVGLTSQTLKKMRRDGRGPRYRKHGRYVRYHIADLDEWSKNSGAGDRPKSDSGDDGSGGKRGILT
jgi:excisionase family DNA binding protein